MKSRSLLFVPAALLFLSFLLVPASTSAQVTLHTSFGPGQTSDIGAGIGIFGADPYTPTPNRWVATAFTPSTTAQLTQIDVAAVITPDQTLNLSNQLVVQLCADLAGQPGTVLESWVVLDLPAADSATVTTLTSVTHVKLSKGSTYWVILGPGVVIPGVSVEDAWNLTSVTVGSGPLEGTVLQSPDESSWADIPCCAHNKAQVPAFDVIGQPSGLTKFPYVYPGPLQILRLVLAPTAFPAPIPPGGPVEATLGFIDSNGNPVGPSSQVSVSPGQIASLDFDVSSLVKSLGPNAGVPVRPIISPVNGAAGFSGEVSASAEIFDKILGFTTVVEPGNVTLEGAPQFAPVGLAAGQSIRITAFAWPPDPCFATLGFADPNGVPIGPTLPVSLNVGQSASLMLNFASLNRPAGGAGRLEIQPSVTLTPPITSAVFTGNSCPASVDVVDNLSGRTMTHQSGLPAVQ